MLKFSGVYSQQELSDIARSLIKHGFECWRFKGQFKNETIKVAVKYNLTMNYASYITLATSMKAKYYTADEELLNKVTYLKIVKHMRNVTAKELAF